MHLLLQIKKRSLLLLLSISISIQAGVPEGVEAFNKNQYAKARVELEKPAEAGDAEAMAYMADMFLRGLGGSRDELKARNYINAAHGKGNYKATFLLGMRADSKLKCNTRSKYEERTRCQVTIQSLV